MTFTFNKLNYAYALMWQRWAGLIEPISRSAIVKQFFSYTLNACIVHQEWAVSSSGLFDWRINDFHFQLIKLRLRAHVTGARGQIEPISTTTGQEAVMLTTSHEFLT